MPVTGCKREKMEEDEDGWLFPNFDYLVATWKIFKWKRKLDNRSQSLKILPFFF